MVNALALGLGLLAVLCLLARMFANAKGNAKLSKTLSITGLIAAVSAIPFFILNDREQKQEAARLLREDIVPQLGEAKVVKLDTDKDGTPDAAQVVLTVGGKTHTFNVKPSGGGIILRKDGEQ
jgi:uncharacterized membrane protein YebE (DUF533 family)